MKKVLIVVPKKSSRTEYINQLAGENREVMVLAEEGEKGEAMKHALRVFQEEYITEEYSGVLLLDTDRVLPPEDVDKLICAFQKNPDALHVGSTKYTARTASKKVTSTLFQFFYGERVRDIQSPVQLIPAEQVPILLDSMKRTTFWDTRVLTKLAVKKVPIKEVPVEIEAGEGMPWKLYVVLLSVFIKYSLSSFSSFLVDILFFQLFLFFTRHLDDQMRIILSTIAARIVSSVYNFLVNNFIVFKNQQQHRTQWIRYYSLVLFEMMASSLLVAGFFTLTHWNETLLKIIVDGGLFFLGYYLEKRFIF